MIFLEKKRYIQAGHFFYLSRIWRFLMAEDLQYLIDRIQKEAVEKYKKRTENEGRRHHSD